jgi:ubiquinone/menaquinone biosynthesis C-methylase UbiE
MKLKLPVSHFPRQFDPNILEMMDQKKIDPVLLREDLINLQKINYWLGSYRLLHRELEIFFSEFKTTKSQPCQILDLCTASGDIPRVIARWARKHHHEIRITATDINPSMLDQARQESNGYSEIRFEKADILNPQYPDKSYDLVLCNLALHHLSVDDAVKALKEMWRITRKTILVNDLHRSRSLCFFAKHAIPLFSRNPMTRFDSYLSTRRSFTSEELLRLGFHAGINDVQIRQYFLARHVLVATK